MKRRDFLKAIPFLSSLPFLSRLLPEKVEEWRQYAGTVTLDREEIYGGATFGGKTVVMETEAPSSRTYVLNSEYWKLIEKKQDQAMNDLRSRLAYDSVQIDVYEEV